MPEGAPADEPTRTLVVAPAQAGLTVWELLGDLLPDVPTSELRLLLQHQGVSRGGRPTSGGQHLAAGDRLELWTEGLSRIAPRRLPGLELLHCDPELLACAKPAGVAVEAERGSDALPLKAGLLHLLRAADEPSSRLRIAHRLDRDTSGVLLVARSREALRSLTAQFEARQVEKEYLALVCGSSLPDAGICEEPLAQRGRRRGRGPVVADPEGKPARTRWEVLERFGRHSWLRVRPETGRQHQIRVHLAGLGHPIAVDALYGQRSPLLLSRLKPGYRRKGEERPLLARLGLHAQRVRLRALGGEALELEAPLPRDLQVALKLLRKHDPA